jgi:hypothetical protein
MVLATSGSVVGLLFLVLAGISFLTAGLAIIGDWRGWGTRSYRFMLRHPLPGVGFYRDAGYGTYRILIGGGYAVMGLAFLVVAAVALTRW